MVMLKLIDMENKNQSDGLDSQSSKPETASLTQVDPATLPSAVPLAVISNQSTNSDKTKKVILLTIVIVVIVGIFIGAAYLWSHFAKSGSKPKVTVGNTTNLLPIVKASAVSSNYQLFQKGTDPGSYTVQVSLLDQSGKVTQTANSSVPLNFVGMLGNNVFLLQEDKHDVEVNTLFKPSGNNVARYWIASPTGINVASDQVNKYLGTLNGGIYPLATDEVLYRTCASGHNYTCSLNLLNITTGQNNPLPSKSIKNLISSSIVGQLDQISSDGKYYYFISPNLISPSKVTLNFIAYDYTADKINYTQNLTSLNENSSSQSSGSDTFAISPNGKYIAYTPDGSTKLAIYNVETNKQTEVSMPNKWAFPSVSPILIWSPDSSNLAFELSVEPKGRLQNQNTPYNEAMAYLGLNNMKVNVVGTNNTEILENNGGEVALDYHNPRWVNNSTFIFGQINNTSVSGRQPLFGTNYSYNISSGSLTTITSNYGGYIAW